MNRPKHKPQWGEEAPPPLKVKKTEQPYQGFPTQEPNYPKLQTYPEPSSEANWSPNLATRNWSILPIY